MHTTTSNASNRRTRVLPAITALAALVLIVPAPVAAQEASPEAASASPAAELERPGIAFPIMLGGQVLTAETWAGSEWLDQFRDGESEDPVFIEGTEALVESVGKTLDDLTVKSALAQPAEGNHVAVLALRIDDTDARDFVEDAVQLLMGDVMSPEFVLRPLGTKWSLRLVDAEQPGVYPRTIYLLDDTAWVIEGDEEYVWDALDQLPDPEPVGASAADSLTSEIPMTLDGRRRTGLYEATEPLFLPTLEAYLGSWIEPWLIDLYLGAGVSPSEMLGVVAWWGIESVQDSIQIEGYRLPEAAQASIESLQTDIFLGGEDATGTVIEGVPQEQREIAGRTVTTLDYDPAAQHIFLSESGDTVWIVTDNAAEPALAEEAIAALP